MPTDLEKDLLLVALKETLKNAACVPRTGKQKREIVTELGRGQMKSFAVLATDHDGL